MVFGFGVPQVESGSTPIAPRVMDQCRGELGDRTLWSLADGVAPGQLGTEGLRAVGWR